MRESQIVADSLRVETESNNDLTKPVEKPSFAKVVEVIDPDFTTKVYLSHGGSLNSPLLSAAEKRASQDSENQDDDELKQISFYDTVWFKLICAIIISAPTAFTAFVSRLGGKVDHLESFDDLITLWNGSDQKAWAMNSLISSELVNMGVNYYFLIPNFKNAAEIICDIVYAVYKQIRSYKSQCYGRVPPSASNPQSNPKRKNSSPCLNLFFLIWSVANGLAFGQISKDSFKLLGNVASYIPFILAFGQYFTTRLNGMEVTRRFFLRLLVCSNSGSNSAPVTLQPNEKIKKKDKDNLKKEIAEDLIWFHEKKHSTYKNVQEQSMKGISNAMRDFLIIYYEDVNSKRETFDETKWKARAVLFTALPLALWIGASIWPVMVPKIIGGGESLCGNIEIGSSHQYKDPASLFFGYLFGSATAFFYARSSYYLMIRLIENLLMIRQIKLAANLSDSSVRGGCNAFLWLITLLGCHWCSYWSGDGMMGVVNAEIQNNYLSYIAVTGSLMASIMIRTGFIAAWVTNLSPCLDLLNKTLTESAAVSLNLKSNSDQSKFGKPKSGESKSDEYKLDKSKPIERIDLATARLLLHHPEFQFIEGDYVAVYREWKKRRKQISEASFLSKLFRCCDDRNDGDNLQRIPVSQIQSTP